MVDILMDVEASAVQEREQAEAAENEALRAADEILRNAREASERRQKAIHKKALRKLYTRLAVAVSCVGGLWLALVCDLIAWQLAIPLECGFMIWAAFNIGAWFQFRYCKEGMLK